MGQQSRNMSERQSIAAHKWPCDGVRRYTVKEMGDTQLTYSEAYQILFHETGCSVDAKKVQLFTREGFRRISLLNISHTRIAAKFLQQAVREDLVVAALVNAAKPPAPEPNPNTTPDAEPEPDKPAVPDHEVGAAADPVPRG